ncbi:AbiV family abortive infection protein [Rhodococcus koreensis]|nr:AbiV family abortive infection protein [Rhodococcus koreensis]
MVKIAPDEARVFWKALMDNASSLIADAHVLLAAGSYGRSRSLTVSRRKNWERRYGCTTHSRTRGVTETRLHALSMHWPVRAQPHEEVLGSHRVRRPARSVLGRIQLLIRVRIRG